MLISVEDINIGNLYRTYRKHTQHFYLNVPSRFNRTDRVDIDSGDTYFVPLEIIHSEEWGQWFIKMICPRYPQALFFRGGYDYEHTVKLFNYYFEESTKETDD